MSVRVHAWGCVCVCVQKLGRAVLIMDKGGGETSSNLLPESAVSNLASSNGQAANGRAIPQGQQLSQQKVVYFHIFLYKMEGF